MGGFFFLSKRGRGTWAGSGKTGEAEFIFLLLEGDKDGKAGVPFSFFDIKEQVFFFFLLHLEKRHLFSSSAIIWVFFFLGSRKKGEK